MAERYDLAGRLGDAVRTPSGGIRVPGWISRTGVQSYQTADGDQVREYRPADEVFDEVSYSSFEGAPITIDHPSELVNPSTWRDTAVGYVRNVRPDGTRLAADLYVEDIAAIAAIEAGELVELSAGYHAEVSAEIGDADGESYDAVQRTIRGNHVALGPAGWGRAGPTVRLRVDAACQVANKEDKMSDKKTVRIDGYEFEYGSESHVKALETKLGALTADLSAEVKRADAAEEKAKEKDESPPDEEMDARVNARISLLDRARKVLGDGYEWAGKTDRDIMTDALAKSGVELAEDSSDDFVAGAFSAAAAKADTAPEEEPPAEEPEEEEDPDRADGRFTFAAPESNQTMFRMPTLSEKWRS